MSKKISGGYILLAKKMVGSEIMDKPPLYLKLWVWMLTQANFRPEKGLERGQFRTSIKEMQEAMTHYVGARKVVPTKRQIRDIYTYLSKVTPKGTRAVTSKVTGGLLVTISNYDEYQDPKNYESHTESHTERPPKGTSIHYRKKENEEMNKDSCPEPEKSDSEPDDEIFLEIPLIKRDGSHPVTLSKLEDWQNDFPGVDVRQQLRNIRQWNIANTSRRKTKAGIEKHIVGWLSREQDRARKPLNGTRQTRSEKNLQACQSFIDGAPE